MDGSLNDIGLIVVGKWRAREIVRIANEAAQAATDGDPEEVLDGLERQILELRPDSGVGLKHVNGADYLATLGTEAISGTPSGIKEVDAYLGGLGAGRLITIASRPGVGKTTLALNIAANVAGYESRVAFFSLEMAYGELVERLLARESHLSGTKIRLSNMTFEEIGRLNEAAERVTRWPLYIDDTAALGLGEIRARTMKQKHNEGLDLVVVDYLQLMTPPHADSRVQEVAVITRTLKLLARELQVPVVVLSQLSRAVEIRGGEPLLSDLRESGSIENDSDQVLILYRRQEESDDRGTYVSVKVAKNRHGPTGDFKLDFVPAQSRFGSI